MTITIPDAGRRFISMQVFDEDQYTHQVAYKPGPYTLTRASVGTRYVAVAFRTLADPADKDDMKQAHAVQDSIKVGQPGGPGKFEVPAWDQASQKKVRDLLIALSDTLPDKNRMFGTRAEVDPVRFLLGAASAWGGNPDKEAVYLNVVPEKNDGRTVYALKVPASVPVDGFWSVSLYNKDGFFEKNELDAYSLNNITAKKNADGSFDIQFGGCDGKIPNCLPITAGWNYMVRLYRPHAEILSGAWAFRPLSRSRPRSRWSPHRVSGLVREMSRAARRDSASPPADWRRGRRSDRTAFQSDRCVLWPHRHTIPRIGSS